MFSFADTLAGRVNNAARRRGWLPGSSLLPDRRGVTAIEFAIVFPLFLLILVGAIEYGRALQARNEMSFAVSKAVRVINLDPGRSASEIASLLATDLTRYSSHDLSVTVSNATISGSSYMNISVNFPFELIIPLAGISSMTLTIDTLAPLIGPTI